MLKIRLNPGEKIIVNGAVVQNGDKRNVLTFVNPANVLREKDLMKHEDATTKCKKLYFMIQTIMLANGSDKSGLSEHVSDISAELFASQDFDGAREHVIDVMDHFSSCDYYKALVGAKKIVEIEEKNLRKKGSASEV